MKGWFWGNSGLFNWWNLRSVGNLVILKVSYPTLVLTPFITKYKAISQFLHIYDNYITLLVFFGSLSLAISNLIYDIFCPTIVKRFDSPNTMYKEMLDIKIRSLVAEPSDKFNSSIIHCKESYNKFSESKYFAGISCATLYIISALLFALVFIDRVWGVILGIAQQYFPHCFS